MDVLVIGRSRSSSGGPRGQRSLYIDPRRCQPAQRIDGSQSLRHAGPVSVDVASCTPLVREALTAEQAADLSRVLKAVADPARLRLLSLVAAHEGGEACVCDLTEPLGLSQPTVSHHLKVLVDAGLLTREKRGVWAWFRLVPGALDALAAVLSTAGSRDAAPSSSRRGAEGVGFEPTMGVTP
ncbi:ArsR/SmtB family transcription factor [Geodermatophilus normandii]|uniref:ArsR/SmtB family transcription factor n=1 Tax=Geodermatophilus normandii TaxID=1137989 RepID=UPI0031F3202F